MKRRITAAVLLALLISAFSLPVSAVENPFSDVRATDWFYNDVIYAYELGLMGGTGESAFEPNTAATRGMLVTILHRLEGSPAPESVCAFTDVAEGAWYEQAVSWAAENGIVSGYSPLSFGPGDQITREQLAAVLYRYACFKGLNTGTMADLSGYADLSEVSGYALDAFRWANAASLINGISPTLLSPRGSATRAQAAAILGRFYNLNKAEAGKGEPQTPAASETSPTGGGEAPHTGTDISDENGKNIFRLTPTPENDGKSVVLTLTLEGEVLLCGFDLRLLYDAEALSFKSLDTACDLQIFSDTDEEKGSIAFNYSTVRNITKEKTVLRASFDIIGTPDADAFTLTPVEIIALDGNNEIINAEYTLTHCGIAP